MAVAKEVSVEPYYDDGQVTIYNADCRDVLATLADNCAAALITDPPYGIDYRSNFRSASEKFDRIANDAGVSTDWFAEAWRCVADGGAGYVATRWDVFPTWKAELAAHASPRNVIVWHKPGGGIGDLTGDYIANHEFVMYLPKGRHTLRGKREGNVWTVPKDAPGSYEHPTQKPVGLMARMIEKSTDPGDLIIDPFMGSGSTLRAAKDTGRRAIGIEIEERYCEIAVARMAQGSLFRALDNGAA